MILQSLAVAAALVAANPAHTYYVDGATGDDRGPGTSSAPFRTFDRAVAGLLPGDEVRIRGGVYHTPLNLTRSGAPNAPIRVVGEHRPHIVASGDAISITGSYVSLRGFDAHSTDWGSAVAVGKHNHHVTITDNILHDSGCGGVSAQYMDYLVVRHNTVFGNARRSPWQCSGISLYHPEAFDHAPGAHNVIEANISYDNQNAVVDEGTSHSHGHTTDGNGIILDDGDHSQAESSVPPYEELSLILGNVVFDNGGRGIHVFHTANVVVAHNVAFEDLKDPKLQGPASELSAAIARRVTFIDNIVVTRPGALPMMDGWDKAPTRWTHNLYQATLGPRAEESPTRFDPTNFSGAPSFVRPSPTPGGDFHLRSDSAARHAGIGFHLGPNGNVILEPNHVAPLGLMADEVPGAHIDVHEER